MIVYALCNLKGGAGKTTSAVALAEALSHQGQRVLVLDMDPQATCSRWMAASANHMTRLLDGAFEGSEHVQAVTKRIHLVAGNRSLARVEDKRAAKIAMRLERFHEAAAATYDVVLIDPPPSVGTLVTAALIASDEVLSPVEAGPGAVDGLSDTLAYIRRTGGAAFRGAFACRVDVRTTLDRQVPELLLEEFGAVEDGGKAFRTYVRETVQMREAQAAHALPRQYASSMTAVKDYQRLTDELQTHAPLTDGR